MDAVNGIFRKKQSFTMVPNEVARNRNLSQRAKGLYVHIMSYITYEDFNLTKSFLIANSIEGEKAFDNSWNELKRMGYLKIYFIKAERGRWRTEYDLLETATNPEVHTFYCDTMGNILSTNMDRQNKKDAGMVDINTNGFTSEVDADNNLGIDSCKSTEKASDNNEDVTYDVSENKEDNIIKKEEKEDSFYRTPLLGVTEKIVEKSPYPPFGGNRQGRYGKGGNNNNTNNNTNNNAINKDNPSFHPSEEDGGEEIQETYESYLEKLRVQVDYYRDVGVGSKCLKRKKQRDYDDILNILADIINAKSIKINQEKIPVNLIKDRFKLLKAEHIEYLLSMLKNYKGTIKNARAFILTAAYNSITSIGLYQVTEAIYDISNPNE